MLEKSAVNLKSETYEFTLLFPDNLRAAGLDRHRGYQQKLPAAPQVDLGGVRGWYMPEQKHGFRNRI